jgi:hypothetical protein
MANHGVVRTDDLEPIKIVSAKYYVSTTATAVDNGNVLKVEALISGEREIYKAEKPAANTSIDDIILIATPELFFDGTKINFVDFVNEAGDRLRGYRLHSGNTFNVTADAISAAATIARGDIVELQADPKLKVVAAATGLTSGSTQVGTILDIETVGTLTYYVVKVK